MKNLYFSLLFLFLFFTGMIGSALASGEPDEIVLIGPQWAVQRVCGEIHAIFPNARLNQVVREGKTSLQFKKDRTTVKVMQISLDALVRPGRTISDEALASIRVWQNLTPSYEYRRGCQDNPWPRYSEGQQVWAKAPLLKRVYEISDKGNGLAKAKSVVCGRDTCEAFFCSPHRVPMDTAVGNLPSNAVQLWGESDGSYQPVSTVGLWVEAD